MSARRQARQRTPVLERPQGPAGVPAALAIGRCVEVWADPSHPTPSWSATRRFNLAREAWARQAEAEDAEARALIPDGSPWSLDHKAGAARFAAAGYDLADVAELAAQADDLFAASLGRTLARAYRRNATAAHR